MTSGGVRRVLYFLLLTLLLAIPFAPLHAQSVPVPVSQKMPPGDWRVLSKGGYAIYHEPVDQKAANELFDLFDRFDDEFLDHFDLEMPGTIRVWIAPTEGRFRLLTSGTPHWTGGLARPQHRLIILQSPRIMPSHGQFSVTALHELVHVLTGHEAAGRLPRWLSEGLAMYLSGETMYKNRTPLGRAVVFNQTYTLDGIDDMMRLGPEQARVAYLQSISFVEYLVDHFGWYAVSGLLHGYMEGRDADIVFEELTGTQLYDVEVAWHQELKDRYRWFNLLAWVNFDTILWSGAAMLVMVVGMTAIIKRRRELHSDDSYIDESMADPKLYEGDPLFDDDDPPGGEWYIERDEPWR